MWSDGSATTGGRQNDGDINISYDPKLAYPYGIEVALVVSDHPHYTSTAADTAAVVNQGLKAVDGGACTLTRDWDGTNAAGAAALWTWDAWGDATAERIFQAGYNVAWDEALASREGAAGYPAGLGWALAVVPGEAAMLTDAPLVGAQDVANAIDVWVAAGHAVALRQVPPAGGGHNYGDAGLLDLYTMLRVAPPRGAPGVVPWPDFTPVRNALGRQANNPGNTGFNNPTHNGAALNGGAGAWGKNAQPMPDADANQITFNGAAGPIDIGAAIGGLVPDTICCRIAGSLKIEPPTLAIAEPTYSRAGDTITATWQFSNAISKQQITTNAPVCSATNTKTNEKIKMSGQRRFEYDAGAQTGTFHWDYEVPKSEPVLLSFSDNAGNARSINTAFEPTVEEIKDERIPEYKGCWRAAFDSESKKGMWGFAADGGENVRSKVTFVLQGGDERYFFEDLPGRSYFEETNLDGKCWTMTAVMRNTVSGKEATQEKVVDLRHN
jgi:hypothetical protein